MAALAGLSIGRHSGDSKLGPLAMKVRLKFPPRELLRKRWKRTSLLIVQIQKIHAAPEFAMRIQGEGFFEERSPVRIAPEELLAVKTEAISFLVCSEGIQTPEFAVRIQGVFSEPHFCV
jgi:hypothetical protein